MTRILAVMVLVGVVIAGVLLASWKVKGTPVDQRGDVGANDPVLGRLRATNRALAIEKRLNDDFNRVPVYWIKDSTLSGSIPLPKSVAEDDSVRVKFVPCDVAAIPARLQYPGATVTSCVRVTSGDHVLDAFTFVAKARLDDLVTHFDGPATGRRFDHRYAEDTGHDGVLADGTRGFLYSYFLYEGGTGQNFEVQGFVGYQRRRVQPS